MDRGLCRKEAAHEALRHATLVAFIQHFRSTDTAYNRLPNPNGRHSLSCIRCCAGEHITWQRSIRVVVPSIRVRYQWGALWHHLRAWPLSSIAFSGSHLSSFKSPKALSLPRLSHFVGERMSLHFLMSLSSSHTYSYPLLSAYTKQTLAASQTPIVQPESAGEPFRKTSVIPPTPQFKCSPRSSSEPTSSSSNSSTRQPAEERPHSRSVSTTRPHRGTPSRTL